MNEKLLFLTSTVSRLCLTGPETRSEPNTDFTAEKMISYIGGELHRLEAVADEIIAIKDLRDRLIKKIYPSTPRSASINYTEKSTSRKEKGHV